MMRRFERYWYSINLLTILLWPLSLLYGAAVTLRRLAYRWGVLRSRHVDVPVIVVGNITVGGTGKTPLVIRLATVLREAGYRPGIISRGYLGQSSVWPCRVAQDSDPLQVGDEPVLLARRSRCPVVVDPDRFVAAQTLLNDYDCDVILADDGLQHYGLARNIEIAVIDGARQFGNGACLPAGPLREPARRLRTVDFIVSHGIAREGQYRMTLTGERAINLNDSYVSCFLEGFRGEPVHAVAGIGDPARFFDFLKERGIRTLNHAFPDHYPYTPADLEFEDELSVLMTEKDAVKCQRLVPDDRFWYIPVDAQIDPVLEQKVLTRLARHCKAGVKTAK
jgi:tetraacyldisaccharide 4'-kinase